MRDIYQATAEMMVSSKERWESVRTQAYAARGETADVPATTYDEMKEFTHSRKYEIAPDQTFQISLGLGSVDTIRQALILRKWTLLVSADDAGDFVTSDHPVCLLDISGRPSSSVFGVGFGMSETAVLFPVSRKLLLSGTFEGTEGVLTAGPIDVAQLNSQIIQRAKRQVYAYDQMFKYYRPSGMAEGSHLVRDELFINSWRV